MSDVALERAILDSIWQRIMWDFLLQNTQLEAWLVDSQLQATPDPDVFKLVVVNPATVDWLNTHTFTIRRSLSQELKRPVEVRVVAVGGI